MIPAACPVSRVPCLVSRLHNILVVPLVCFCLFLFLFLYSFDVRCSTIAGRPLPLHICFIVSVSELVSRSPFHVPRSVCPPTCRLLYCSLLTPHTVSYVLRSRLHFALYIPTLALYTLHFTLTPFTLTTYDDACALSLFLLSVCCRSFWYNDIIGWARGSVYLSLSPSCRYLVSAITCDRLL